MNYLKLSILVWLFLSVYSCNVKKDKNIPYEKTIITHELGEVIFLEKPTRIVALDYSSIENLDELKIPMVGIPKDKIPSHLHKFESDSTVANIGGLFDIDFLKLKELKPDLIFISSRQKRNYEALSEIAPVVYFKLSNKNYINSFAQVMNAYGRIFAIKSKTDSVVQKITTNTLNLSQKASTSGKTAMVIMHNDGELRAFGKGTSFGIIHDTFGFKAAVEDLEIVRKGQLVSSEFIKKANPDYLFIIDRTAAVSQQPTNKAEIENEIIRQTNAYKNGKITYLDPEIWYLSGNGITSLNKMINELLSAI